MKALLNISPRTTVAAAVTLALVVCVSAGLVVWAGWREVVGAVERLSAPMLACSLATSLACYGIRFMRWHWFTVALGYRVPWLANLRIYIAGLGFTWTPGKCGELLRGVFLARYDVPFPQTILLFYWDRLSDLAGMLMLALLATLALASGHLVLMPVILGIVIALWLVRPGGPVFSRVVGYLQHRDLGRHRRWLDGLMRLRDADAALTTRLAIVGTLAGAGAYAMQAVGLMIIAQSSGAEIGFAAALLVMSVSTLAGAATLLPAGAGVVETTSVGLLVAQGLSLPDAVAIGLVHRVTTFWFAMVLGAGALASCFAAEVAPPARISPLERLQARRASGSHNPCRRLGHAPAQRRRRSAQGDGPGQRQAVSRLPAGCPDRRRIRLGHPRGRLQERADPERISANVIAPCPCAIR